MIVNVARAVNPALIILWYKDKARRIDGACVDRVWLLLVVQVALVALMVLPTSALCRREELEEGAIGANFKWYLKFARRVW